MDKKPIVLLIFLILLLGCTKNNNSNTDNSINESFNASWDSYVSLNNSYNVLQESYVTLKGFSDSILESFILLNNSYNTLNESCTVLNNFYNDLLKLVSDEEQEMCCFGWKCKNSTHKGYQFSNCSWSNITYCENGCEDNTCLSQPETYCDNGTCQSDENCFVETCPTTGSFCSINDLYDYNGCVTNDCDSTFVESCTTDNFCNNTNLYQGDGCSTDHCADHIVDTCDNYYCSVGNDRYLKTGCTGTACTTKFIETCPSNYYCDGYDRRQHYCSAGECTSRFVETCPSNYYCDGNDKRQNYCSAGECTSRFIEASSQDCPNPCDGVECKDRCSADGNYLLREGRCIVINNLPQCEYLTQQSCIPYGCDPIEVRCGTAFCGNGICDEDETFTTCPADCMIDFTVNVAGCYYLPSGSSAGCYCTVYLSGNDLNKDLEGQIWLGSGLAVDWRELISVIDKYGEDSFGLGYGINNSCTQLGIDEKYAMTINLRKPDTNFYGFQRFRLMDCELNQDECAGCDIINGQIEHATVCEYDKTKNPYITVV